LKKLFSLIAIYIVAFSQVIANHLIGGELSYRCEGGDNYLIELSIYRDCNCTMCADFDDPATLTIFDGNNVFLRSEALILTGSKRIRPNIEGLCLETVPDVCVEKALGYKKNIKLPPSLSGYRLVYQRCCRNNTISNIVNPGDTGSTYEVIIPPNGVATCNNSPVFDNFPPIVICAGFPLEFNNAATDLDGDSLVYELCTPNRGATPQDPQPTIASKPPYPPIVWEDDFGVTDQIGGDMFPLKIDEASGLLTGFPNIAGQFVVGICVKEFRNNLLLSTSVRDFQFNISDCGIVKAKVKSDDITPEGVFIIKDCEGFAVQFTNESVGADNYYWDFGDPTTSDDTSDDKNPFYEYPDTGVYTIMMVADPYFECSDTAIVELSLYPTLIPQFSYQANCFTTPVEFTDISTSDYGRITEWVWDFGDRGPDSISISNDTNPIKRYELPGTYDVTLSIKTELGCIAIHSENIDLKATPESNYGNTALCLDAQPIEFSDSSDINIGSIQSWNWVLYNSDSTDVDVYNQKDVKHSFPEPGDYKIFLEVTASNGCKAVKTESVTIYDVIEIDAGMDENICTGDSVQLNGTTNIEQATFTWLADDTTKISRLDIENPLVYPDATTTYTVYAEDPNGCITQDEVNVNLRPIPYLNIGDDLVVCKADNINLNIIAEDGYGNTDNLQYRWESNNYLSSTTSPNPIVTPLETTTLILKIIETTYGCENWDSILIEVEEPIIEMVSSDTMVCKNTPFELYATGGDFYNWSPNLGFDIDAARPTITLLQDQVFTVEISNYCYTNTAQIDVKVKELPFVDAGWDFDIDIGDMVELNGMVDTFGVAEYFWTPEINLIGSANSLNLAAQPLQDMTYQLTAISENGCMATDSLMVTVDQKFNLWIPTAFSPNNDGINDAIGIVTKGIKDLDIFRIYNRWGEKVYEANNVESSWDGTYRGVPQDAGVYMFYAVGITYFDEPFQQKGNITLIR